MLLTIRSNGLRYMVRVCTAPFTRSELLHYEEVLEFVTDYKVGKEGAHSKARGANPNDQCEVQFF